MEYSYIRLPCKYKKLILNSIISTLSIYYQLCSNKRKKEYGSKDDIEDFINHIIYINTLSTLLKRKDCEEYYIIDDLTRSITDFIDELSNESDLLLRCYRISSLINIESFCKHISRSLSRLNIRLDHTLLNSLISLADGEINFSTYLINLSNKVYKILKILRREPQFIQGFTIKRESLYSYFKELERFYGNIRELLDKVYPKPLIIAETLKIDENIYPYTIFNISETIMMVSLINYLLILFKNKNLEIRFENRRVDYYSIHGMNMIVHSLINYIVNGNEWFLSKYHNDIEEILSNIYRNRVEKSFIQKIKKIEDIILKSDVLDKCRKDRQEFIIKCIEKNIDLERTINDIRSLLEIKKDKSSDFLYELLRLFITLTILSKELFSRELFNTVFSSPNKFSFSDIFFNAFARLRGYLPIGIIDSYFVVHESSYEHLEKIEIPIDYILAKPSQGIKFIVEYKNYFEPQERIVNDLIEFVRRAIFLEYIVNEGFSYMFIVGSPETVEYLIQELINKWLEGRIREIWNKLSENYPIPTNLNIIISELTLSKRYVLNIDFKQ